MIDLYAMGSANVVKIYIALEEMGLPYTVRPVDVFGEAQFNPAFLKLNPLAKVPVIVDHNGPGGKPYKLFESGAILLYLAQKTGQFLPEDTVERFHTTQWMMVQMTLVGPMFGQYVHWQVSKPRYGTASRLIFAARTEREHAEASRRRFRHGGRDGRPNIRVIEFETARMERAMWTQV